MIELRIVADVIELDGRPVARLLPKLGSTLVYRLTETFDAIGEDDETIARVEARVAQLEEQVKEPAP